MQIALSKQKPIHFQPWKPALGNVFQGLVAIDTETTRIDDAVPWVTPSYVLGAACDGQRGFFVTRDRLADFLAAHPKVTWAMHNAPFDLRVMHQLASGGDLYNAVDEHRVWDTRLLHQLLMLGTEGHVASGKGESTLDACAKLYLDVDLPKDLKDAEGDEVRLSCGKWLNRSPAKIEHIYLEYLAKDATVTYLVCRELMDRLNDFSNISTDAWGCVSQEWLSNQTNRWGFQTHHIQLQGAIVLDQITKNGLCIDQSRRVALNDKLQAESDRLRGELHDKGYLCGGRGSQKAMQEILRKLERQQSGPRLPRTDTGKYSTSQEDLAELASSSPFIENYLAWKGVEKLQSSFVEKMAKQRLHPKFRSLVRTGRTASFGDINAQNLPRNDEVRSCFVPSEGQKFISADYSTIELATLSQCVIEQFRLPSKMGEAINAGTDLHCLVASRVTGKPLEEVTAVERQKAKLINFGKPGGMGNKLLQQIGKNNFGIDLDDVEVERLSETWLELFPEMKTYLRSDGALSLARYFGLTPRAHFEHTGSEKFLNHPSNVGREGMPHAILGMMCMKVLRDRNPKLSSGDAYSAGDIDYFWSQISKRIDDLPSDCRQAVEERSSSRKIQALVIRSTESGSCCTLTGRVRANAGYCARRNTLFQGLAADGAKLALWELWRAGYRIVNFIHDEVLIEVPSSESLTNHAEAIRGLMIAGMQEVVPDILIDVTLAACNRWHKEAEPRYDDAGELIPWAPDSEAELEQDTVEAGAVQSLVLAAP